MCRNHFSQVLNNAPVDIRKEYDSLYNMFYCGHSVTLREYCEDHFMEIPFRGRCTSLNDFDHTYKFNFQNYDGCISKDYLISFCEYSYNLLNYFGQQRCFTYLPVKNYLNQVEKVIEAIGYMANKQGDITNFVPKDQVVIAVAEIVDPSLSYKVLEYNHHSMKGNLERKKAVLLVLAHELEPQQDKLQDINKNFKSDLYFLFNNINIRHNNSNDELVANMSKDELESWYDDTYECVCLLFLNWNIQNAKVV